MVQMDFFVGIGPSAPGGGEGADLQPPALLHRNV
jgi:hypothetical protein